MAKVELTVRLADMERFRLFAWELRVLEDEMRVMASPHADRLSGLIDRFVAGEQGDKVEDDPA